MYVQIREASNMLKGEMSREGCYKCYKFKTKQKMLFFWKKGSKS